MEILELLVNIALAALVAFIFAAIVIFGVIRPLLTNESRYGIDECGNAKTPEYMAKKKAREEWYEVFNRLDND